MNSPIPIIDLNAFHENNNDLIAKQKTAEQVREALHTFGFFYLTNHALDHELQNAALKCAKHFFALKKEEKDSIAISKSPLQRGYRSPQTVGKCNLNSELNDFKENLIFGQTGEGPYFYGDNLFPDECLVGKEWRSTIERYYYESHLLGVRLAKCLALAMNRDERFFVDNMTHSFDHLVLIRYPQATTEEERQREACGQHTDVGLVTLLLQEESAPGLELQQLDGTWVLVEPRRGDFVVNIGDLCARWSNDYFRSTPHRVVLKDSDQPRHSIAFFNNTNYDTVVECIPENDGDSLKYETTTSGEYIREKLGLAKIFTKSDNEK